MSEHIPDIETYAKRLNWYLQEHYPANKKITAEEWNALFLALMNQGNAQEETLEKICNEILPPHVTAINYLLDKEANHTTRIEELEQVTADHEDRIDDLEGTATEYGGRISNLENIANNHGTRIDVLEVDAIDSKARIGVLENTVDHHGSRINTLEIASINHDRRISTLEEDSAYYASRIGALGNITANHESRLSTIEPIVTRHTSELSDLRNLTQTHTTQISGLRTDVDSNASRIGTLENTMLQKAYKTETTLKYNVSNIPSAITYAKNGIKDLLIEFYNETYTVPVAPDTTAPRKGSVIVVGIEEVDDSLVQTEIFKFKEGIVTRQITSSEGTVTAISDWKPINNAYLTDLDNRVDTNTTEIANIKRDYATNATVNAKETALQTQITANRTDINTLLGDYVKKADNTNIDYLTRNELAVSDTGALVQIERLKNITTGTASNPRQTTPIPVVDNKARLFLPQEITSLRDLVSWKNSLLGEALNYLVDFSDFPLNPSQQQLQEYLNNKWASIGGTTPILDQTTMTDESIPLSYRWYVNENAWIFSHGVSDNIATNNLYDEQGTLVTPGSTGKVLGSNKKFYVMYETNGEGAVVGLDALEQDVLNNASDIANISTDLSTYKTSNNTRVGNVESRATALETRATTIEGILPTKLDKITNTLNMQGLYGRKADGTHNLLGADSANTAGSVMLRDLNGNAHIGTPTSDTHIANKKYVDDAETVLDAAISSLTTTVNEIDEYYLEVTNTLSSDLTNEITARTNADTTLQNSITSLTNNKMDKANPTGTGSLSLNRKANTTIGQYSVAEGYMNTASGNYSHAEGNLTTASGTDSHAEGGNSTASGLASHAEGSGTTASGTYSHAEGSGTIAQRQLQHVFGMYNIADSAGNGPTWRGDYVEIVGNGASNTSRSNARTLDWLGNEWLAGAIKPANGLDLTASSKVFKLFGDSQSDNVFFEIDGANYFKLIDSYGKLYSENNEVARKDYVGTGTLTMQLNGANVDTFSANASANKTINIKALPNYSLSLGSTNGGNPRQTLFCSVNYTNFDSNSGAYFKLGAMSGHGNGSSYTFVEDIFINVNYLGAVTCEVYKYVQQAAGNVDNVARNYGDVFYTIDTTNKIVYFYILLGQYSSAQFTPGTKIGPTKEVTTANGIIQYTGTPLYYSSGTKTWANGDSTLYARLSDIPTSINGMSGGSLTSPLVIKGGDATTAAKIVLDQAASGQITNNSTQTIFGFTSNNTTTLTIGHSSYAILLRGNGTRPTYNSNSLALYNEVVRGTYDSATDTFTI